MVIQQPRTSASRRSPVASCLVPDPLPRDALASRRAAVAAALRAVAAEPLPVTPALPVTGALPVAAATPTVPVAAAAPVPVRDEELAARVARLAERLDRLEDSVELIRRDEEPLSWPTPAVEDGDLDRVEVPPVHAMRRPSVAFDMLLGPPARDSA